MLDLRGVTSAGITGARRRKLRGTATGVIACAVAVAQASPALGAIGPYGESQPPQTKITKGAPKKTDKHKVKFKFSSDDPDARFECKLDEQPYKACTSPRKVKHLDEGKHRFKVRAVDATGNVDPSPAKDKFKVVG